MRTPAAIIVLLWIASAACAEKTPSEPDVSAPIVVPPAGLIVSNARGGAPSTSSELGAAFLGSIVYVSAGPGTLTGADSAEIRNRTSNGSATRVPVLQGGFDPVGIEANSGDEIAIRVDQLGAASITFVLVVPPRRLPVVVRTRPSQGRIDVALNVQIEIVFSEPIDKSTLTSSSISLLKDGISVAGKIEASADGTVALFSPDNALVPLTTYSLVINKSVKDRDGDALAEASIVTFTTREDQPASKIVFVGRLDGQIYTWDIGKTEPVLIKTGGQHHSPVWSPDGKRIAFVREGLVFVMDADGSNVVHRSIGGNFYDVPNFQDVAWSPDGTRLAVTEATDLLSNIYRILVVSADGNGGPPEVIVSDGRSPAWSPDGKQIAYVHINREYLWDDGPIYVVNADGTNVRSVVPHSGGFTTDDITGFNRVSWSPDGKRLAYSRMAFDVAGIFTMNADGSDNRMLTDLGGLGSAAWSPDGKWIALHIEDWKAPWLGAQLAYVSSAGSAVTVIGDGSFPSWRP